MENAQLISLSRQITLRNQLNVVANNMANLNTTGFKAERMLFEEVEMPLAEASQFMANDKDLSYVQDYATSYNLLQGGIRMNGNTFDVAMDGEGWFAIQTEDGEAYTRDGSFHLDDRGRLVTAEGRSVLGENGPLIFRPADGQVNISHDGTISTEQGLRGRLKVVSFDTPKKIKAIGENLFTHDDPRPMRNARVIQGALETSNVNGVVEVAHLIEVTRAYETVTNLMKRTDDLRSKAISSLGRLQA